MKNVCTLTQTVHCTITNETFHNTFILTPNLQCRDSENKSLSLSFFILQLSYKNDKIQKNA